MADIVTTDRRRRVLVASCHGDLDLATRDGLRTQLPSLKPASSGGTVRPTDDLDDVDAVVVDLGAVTFLDCSALGVLIAFARECDAARIRLLLARAGRIVIRILTALELHQRFVIASTVDEAIALAETWTDVGALSDCSTVSVSPPFPAPTQTSGTDR